ncbi:MAG: hypothetical protein ABFS56_19940 [Pseudomonadota bacterium]
MYIKSAFPLRYRALAEERDKLLQLGNALKPQCQYDKPLKFRPAMPLS